MMQWPAAELVTFESGANSPLHKSYAIVDVQSADPSADFSYDGRSDSRRLVFTLADGGELRAELTGGQSDLNSWLRVGSRIRESVASRVAPLAVELQPMSQPMEAAVQGLTAIALPGAHDHCQGLTTIAQWSKGSRPSREAPPSYPAVRHSANGMSPPWGEPGWRSAEPATEAAVDCH